MEGAIDLTNRFRIRFLLAVNEKEYTIAGIQENQLVPTEFFLQIL